MKFLIVTLGSIGDLMPFLAVADGLRQRGHKVVIASSAGYAALVQGSGFEFAIVSDRPANSLDDVIAQNPDLAWKRVWDDVFVPAAAPTRAFIAHHAQMGPCTLIASWTALGARQAHEMLKLPLCTVYLSPHALVEDRVTAGPGGQKIALFPSWFGDARDAAATGFPMLDEALVPALPTPLENFLQAGPAPVIFTPGSFVRHCGDFFRASLAACEELGSRAIFLTPHEDQIPASLPPSARHFKFVSLQRLAPHGAALVHHGGIGTCAQALRAGVPQLITPVFFDQPGNAARIAALGVGARLERYTAQAAAEKLREMLGSEAVRGNCAAVREKFRGVDAIAEICDRAEAAV